MLQRICGTRYSPESLTRSRIQVRLGSQISVIPENLYAFQRFPDSLNGLVISGYIWFRRFAVTYTCIPNLDHNHTFPTNLVMIFRIWLFRVMTRNSREFLIFPLYFESKCNFLLNNIDHDKNMLRIICLQYVYEFDVFMNVCTGSFF